MNSLQGKIAIVAGATRGAGRGIACMLGEAGATVYCTGRSTRDHPSITGIYVGRPETIDETAEMVTRYGGKGIPVRTDHLAPRQVKVLVARVRRGPKPAMSRAFGAPRAPTCGSGQRPIARDEWSQASTPTRS